jgi:hypothetical protein
MRLSPTRWTSTAVKADLGGGYRIGGLEAGDYVVCAGAPPALHLADPCVWQDAPGLKKIRIAPRGRVKEERTSLARGQMLEVEVRDPERLLTTKAEGNAANAPGAVRQVAAAVQRTPASVPMPMRVGRPLADGMVYELLVPIGVPGRLVVQAAGVALRDDAQRPVANGRTEVEFTPAGGKDPVKRVFHAGRQEVGR